MDSGRRGEPNERFLLAEKMDQDKGKQQDACAPPMRAYFCQGAGAARGGTVVFAMLLFWLAGKIC